MSELAGTPNAIDRSRWPKGPWDREPDRVDWKTAAGLPAIALRHTSGHWCGYVAVPPGHAFYPGGPHAAGESLTLEGLHGECTYADRCTGRVCHVPEPGEPDDVFWYGFDYAHHMDAAPGSDDPEHGFSVWPDDSGTCLWGPRARECAGKVKGVYRTLDYVRADMEKAAAALQSPPPAIPNLYNAPCPYPLEPKP